MSEQLDLVFTEVPDEPKVRDRPLFGGKYPGGGFPLPTSDWSYWSGFISGRDWDQFYPHNQYVPGGPYVSTDYHTGYRDGAWQDFCSATRINNVRWREGWQHGRQYINWFLCEYWKDMNHG